MEKNNQPLIIAAMVIGAALIISLAFIFTRGDSETELLAENTVSENEENETEEENGNDGDQQAMPQPQPQPDPDPDPAPQPVPEPSPGPDPQPGVLPSNWDSLSVQEKTDLNPLDCDHETQYVRDDNGQCINKLPAQRFARSPFIVEPFVSRFDNGLELEIRVELGCAPIEDGFKDLYGERGGSSTSYESDFISDFINFLESNSVDVSDFNLTAESFFEYAKAHPTDWCIFQGNFTNTGGDYTYLSNGCDRAVYVQDILVDQGDGYLPFYPISPTNFTSLPCTLLETPIEAQFVQGDNRVVTQSILLPAGGDIQSLRPEVWIQVSLDAATSKTLTLPLR